MELVQIYLVFEKYVRTLLNTLNYLIFFQNYLFKKKIPQTEPDPGQDWTGSTTLIGTVKCQRWGLTGGLDLLLFFPFPFLTRPLSYSKSESLSGSEPSGS